jgi:carboxylesterase
VARWFRRLFLALVGLLLLWIVGDFVYARVVQHRMRAWERSVEWRPDGVRAGCADRTVGQGNTALLWIHGFNDCPATFDGLADRVAAAGFTCRVMRLPGFGEKTANYAKTTREQWRQAVRREVETLSREHRRVGIVAHSLGGAIAVDHVLHHPHSLEGLALIAPLVRVSHERSPVLAPHAWHAVGGRTLFSTRIVETPFPVDSTAPRAIAYDKRTRFTPREVFDEIYALLDEINGRAGDVCVPVLLALGWQDEVIDGEAAQRFFAACPAPENRELRLDAAGHMLHMDAGWERLADEIVRFFSAPPAVVD